MLKCGHHIRSSGLELAENLIHLLKRLQPQGGIVDHVHWGASYLESIRYLVQLEVVIALVDPNQRFVAIKTSKVCLWHPLLPLLAPAWIIWIIDRRGCCTGVRSCWPLVEELLQRGRWWTWQRTHDAGCISRRYLDRDKKLDQGSNFACVSTRLFLSSMSVLIIALMSCRWMECFIII